MHTIFLNLKLIVTDPVLRGRILFLVGAVAIFRFLAAVPIPGVDRIRLSEFLADNQFLGLLNIFSGGGFSALSIVMLGVGPYITASIIMQLGTVVFPMIKRMYSEEGEAGRAKFIEWSRVLTIPLAVLQGVAFAAIALVATYAVVHVSEAERSIPIAYARQVRGVAMQAGAATYLPIRLL